ncbi:MAG: DinB family protein [Treponema sp.]|jgi:uncharacterized damage-inducible protein DinB|nr:DinB family protein [Treponema sp.]
MKEPYHIHARYNRQNNKTIYTILDALPNEEREKERGSYYSSLSGLYRHILGGTSYFLSLFKDALPNNAGVQKAVAPALGQAIPEGPLSAAQWKALEGQGDRADTALVDFVSALKDEDFQAPVKVEWYGGNPASTPLYFMLEQLHSHNTHHRGQISQILDELKIDNDYSGIDIALLP